jgi:tRNA1(Val) A37 N6-methylase TrmN6
MIEQTKGHSFNLDTVLLAKFLKLSKKIKNILDVGTGNGALLLYASEISYAKLLGIEIQEIRYDLAKKNMKLNQLEDRSEIILGDYLKQTFENLDCIISNPPFFKTLNESKLSNDEGARIARHEMNFPLEEFIKKASLDLKFGGYFYMIHRADRFVEIMRLLDQHQLVAKRIKFVHPYRDKPANHVLIQCIKQGGQSLILEPPLIIYEKKHQYTKAFEEYIGGKINVT